MPLSGRWDTPWSYNHQAVALRQQAETDAATVPPGELIYSEVPADLTRLAKQPGFETFPLYSLRPSIRRWSPIAQDADRLEGSFHSDAGPPVGRRHAPGGPWRTIELTAWCSEWTGRVRHVQFPACEVKSIATKQRGSRQNMLTMERGPSIELTFDDIVSLSAGQLDPADASHLTIDYTLNSEPGVIDGWLWPDDRMTFAIRTGPATTRPATGYGSPPSP